jgi:alkylhydroperoxidase family enzyme
MSGGDRQALVHLVAGFTAWAIGFVLLYALQALGCAYGWSQHRLILLLAYGVTLLPLAWFAWRRTAPATTLSTSALWANRAALAAGVLVFLPVTFATLCQ